MSLKGLHLTDRDIEIFKYLACGPAFSDDLHARFFVRGGGLTSRQAFQIRMRGLEKDQYIECLRFRKMPGKSPGIHKPVYAIAEGGIGILVSLSIMPIERIRRVHLHPPTLFHEITLTRFVRRIYEGEPRRYQVIRLDDHGMLAKQVQKVRAKRIPDLRFTVQLPHGSYYSFLVEIDAGSTYAHSEFVQKLVAFRQLAQVLAPADSKDSFTILIVCHTADRMALLQHAVMRGDSTIKIWNRFLFNTIQNIDNSLGLLNPWYRADGGRIDLIFKR